MSQSGYTPIQLYRTTTAAAQPVAGNLAAGEIAINTTDGKLYFKTTGGTVTLLSSSDAAAGTFGTANITTGNITTAVHGAGAVGTPSMTFTGDLNTGLYSPTADQVAIATGGSQRMLVYGTGFFDGVFSDKVVAVGNTGTAQTLDVSQGNVFTATLTGNCTFTLSGANAASSRASSFTLVLTNDGTAGRTVAFSGGTFRYPGGSVTRTTTANAVDVWFFFTPNNGTTWYVSIPMANLS
jgi:hypothetical protein